MPRIPVEGIDQAEIHNDIGIGMTPKKRHEVKSILCDWKRFNTTIVC